MRVGVVVLLAASQDTVQFKKEGSKCVSMTWRAVSDRPHIQQLYQGCAVASARWAHIRRVQVWQGAVALETGGAVARVVADLASYKGRADVDPCSPRHRLPFDARDRSCADRTCQGARLETCSVRSQEGAGGFKCVG
jgi:hypothetical protein